MTDSEREQLDIESISEYVRESKSRTRAFLQTASIVTPGQRAVKTSVVPAVLPLGIDTSEDAEGSPKPDILETLWPGLHHQDFSHSVKRTPSFYLTLGFMGGAVIALFIVWGFYFFSSFFAHYGKLSSAWPQSKTISGSGQQVAPASGASSTEVLVPLVSTYEVQTGDTLAAIALRNYKHISPRLVDAICKANNMTDANVLGLGQKIVLPEYQPQNVSSQASN
jgi:LysM repeat protein